MISLSKDTQLQFIKFCTVGGFNTVIDFLFINAFVLIIGLPIIMANTLSVSISMIISYLLNRTFTFKHKEQRTLSNFIIFIVITSFGVYVLQAIVIVLLTSVWTVPVESLYSFFEKLSPFEISLNFFRLNFAKMIATSVSLIWNFIMYKKVVFKT